LPPWTFYPCGRQFSSQWYTLPAVVLCPSTQYRFKFETGEEILFVPTSGSAYDYGGLIHKSLPMTNGWAMQRRGIKKKNKTTMDSTHHTLRSVCLSCFLAWSYRLGFPHMWGGRRCSDFVNRKKWGSIIVNDARVPASASCQFRQFIQTRLTGQIHVSVYSKYTPSYSPPSPQCYNLYYYHHAPK
jgi:hypothetical protein